MDPRVRAACAAVRELAMQSLERVEHPLVTLVRDASKPDVWDANHACHVRAQTAAEIDEVFAFVERELPGSVTHRDFRCDPETPPAFVAHLLHEGFAASTTIQMRLDGPVAREVPPLALRPLATDVDWQRFEALDREVQEEEAAREGRAPYARSVTAGLVALKRAGAPAVRLWLASDGGEDVGHVGAFRSSDGVGIVEWVSVRRSARRRGVASAMVAHAVATLRDEGASPCLIGPADGDYDAPRRCYAGLGFAPWFVTQQLIRA